MHFDLTEGERAYGYVRVETGDELSKRAKFAFITWIGESVPALQKAKVSTDKATVKQVIQVRALDDSRATAMTQNNIFGCCTIGIHFSNFFAAL